MKKFLKYTGLKGEKATSNKTLKISILAGRFKMLNGQNIIPGKKLKVTRRVGYLF